MLQAARIDIKSTKARPNAKPASSPATRLASPVPILGNQATLRLQRKCDCGGGPDCHCDSVPDNEKKVGTLHREAAGPGALPAAHAGARPVGHTLDASTQAFFEARHQCTDITRSGAKTSGALEVSEPSDPAELEAARVVDRLFPASAAPRAPCGLSKAPVDGSAPAPLALRKTEAAVGSSRPCCGRSSGLPGAHADSGTALTGAPRQEMEAAFGTDFSSVRVHTNPGAAQLARSLRAHAFTYGNEIFFDQGRYDPQSPQGKRLLAHELTHVVQQRDAIAKLSRDGAGRTTLQCVNDNLSSAGVASWLIGIVGGTCGLIFGVAGSPTGPGAAGTAAFGAALCIAGVIGFSVGAVLGVISGCWSDPNFKSRGAYLTSAGGSGTASPAAGGSGTASPAASPGGGAAGGGQTATA